MTSAPAFPTSIRQVIIVLLENENQATVLRQGPFEKHLAQTYASASSYYAICHPSAPNYLSITSGKPSQCGSDEYKVYSTINLGTLVDAAGLTWKAYDESMPQPCDTSNSGLYAVRHNPFLFYADVVRNAAFCRSHDVNSKYFNESAANGTLPNLSFYTPNLLDDGHNTNVAFADKWLKGWLSPLLNDSIFSNSVFFITYDESGNSGSGYNGTAGGKVYFAAVSPDLKAGYALTTDASHYNLLTTIEWLLGLGRTGHHDSWAAWPPMKSLFTGSAGASPVPSGTTASPRAGVPAFGGPLLPRRP
ncbi:MAG: alkaline phosphatase family protein [Thermoplasmata archaeon]